MPPIVVHQAKDYSQDIYHTIPLDWTVHHTPSGFMDRDGWLKAMTQLSNTCGVSPVKNHILFFDGHKSHFDNHSLIQMKSKKIHPFILKLVESINGQLNDNGTNSKLMSLYNISKAKWMMKYGTTRFQPHHMNSVLDETWEAFMVPAGKIIRDNFAKNIILPFRPTSTIINTQAYVASTQIYSKGINKIS